MGKGQALIVGLLLVLVIVGSVSLIFYNNQKTITSNAIKNLEDQLEEQGQLTNEQERELEELAKVTCKDVQVPYDAKEEYTEKEPYSDEVCEDIPLAYNKVKNYCSNYVDNLIFEDEPAKYSITVNNLDPEKGGIFIADIGFIIDGQTVKTEQRVLIEPQSSHSFYAEQMAEVDNCHFNIKEVPTKQECETVTKYKSVTKYRTITKYRTETICE